MFGINPERCSASPRNPVRLRPESPGEGSNRRSTIVRLNRALYGCGAIFPIRCEPVPPKYSDGPAMIELIAFHLFLYSLQQHLSTFTVVASVFKTSAQLRLENVALRQQLIVLRRSTPKRLKLTTADRIFWLWLRRVWADWRSYLVIVKPETVVAWHRKGFRLFWTWKIRHGKPGDLVCRKRFAI